MTAMALKPGVIHLCDRAMLLEKTRNLERTLVLITHPKRQRFHPPMQQKTSVRIERATKMVQLVRDSLHQVGPPNYRAGDDIRMAIQVLGATVERKIEAVFRRAKIYRAGEGVIDHRDNAVGFREFAG